MSDRVGGVIGVLVLSCAVWPLAGCGGSGTPTTPEATLQSIAVAIANELVFLGSSEQATATGTLSNGATRTVTGTWSSDNTNVATVDANGRVAGLQYGRASISFQGEGLTGSRATRVVPRYAGNWVGSYVVRSCVESGDFVGLGVCDAFSPGVVPSMGLSLTQTPRDSVRGTGFLGALQTDPFTVPIEDDGSVAVIGIVRGDAGLTVDMLVQLTSPQPGQLAGRLQQVWKAVGVAGEARIETDIVALAEQSAAASRPASRGARPRSLAEAVGAALGRGR